MNKTGLMDEFDWPVRVYYEDTDAGGVVFYANYLKFMERARTEYLRSLGYEQDVLREREGLIFAVRHVEIDYQRPARFNDLLLVRSRASLRSRTSVTFSQQVLREETCLTDATIMVVCLDAVRFRPRAIPESMSEAFQRVS
jgi:acyl-CoA thioester hydrolase